MDSLMPPPQTPVATSAFRDARPDGGDTGESAKRTRQPRNSACQACATLKMKCIASPSPGVCERCNRLGRDCKPTVPKARKRRATNGTPSDQPSDRPFSGLLGSNASPGAGPEPAARLLTNMGDYSTQAAKGSLLSRPDLTYTGSQGFTALFAQGLGLAANAETLNLLREIDHPYVQRSLNIFPHISVNFPFLDISPTTDAIDMIARRPVLTAAVCTVAAASNPSVQDRLSRAFRHTISAKVIIDGECSIDLLSGLLVYLAWHHHYMAKHQIYQELHILAGMVADLNLDRAPEKAGTINSVGDLERQRVFLGCYYLCCGLSIMGFNKPSPMRWTDSLRSCAESLRRACNLPSDESLLATIELLHTVEDLEDALRVNATVKRETFAYYVELHTKATNQRLRQLKRDHPQLSGTLGYAAATVHFQYKLLRVSNVPDQATLIQCALAIKEYLDDVVARPSITLHQMAIVEWTNLLEILVLLAWVSRPLPYTAGWEADALASMLQPEAIIDTLCSHMNSAPMNDPFNPRNEGLLHWFRGSCESIKKRIQFERDGNMDGGAAPDGRVSSEAYELGRSDDRSLDAVKLFGKGVLEEGFWSNLTNG